jgi:hypothetical protein
MPIGPEIGSGSNISVRNASNPCFSVAALSMLAILISLRVAVFFSLEFYVFLHFCFMFFLSIYPSSRIDWWWLSFPI